MSTPLTIVDALRSFQSVKIDSGDVNTNALVYTTQASPDLILEEDIRKPVKKDAIVKSRSDDPLSSFYECHDASLGKYERFFYRLNNFIRLNNTSSFFSFDKVSYRYWFNFCHLKEQGLPYDPNCKVDTTQYVIEVRGNVHEDKIVEYKVNIGATIVDQEYLCQLIKDRFFVSVKNKDAYVYVQPLKAYFLAYKALDINGNFISKNSQPIILEDEGNYHFFFDPFLDYTPLMDDETRQELYNIDSILEEEHDRLAQYSRSEERIIQSLNYCLHQLKNEFHERNKPSSEGCASLSFIVWTDGREKCKRNKKKVTKELEDVRTFISSIIKNMQKLEDRRVELHQMMNGIVYYMFGSGYKDVSCMIPNINYEP